MISDDARERLIRDELAAYGPTAYVAEVRAAIERVLAARTFDEFAEAVHVERLWLGAGDDGRACRTAMRIRGEAAKRGVAGLLVD